MDIFNEVSNSPVGLQYGVSDTICCGLLNDGRLYMAATSSNGATNSSSVSLFTYNGTSFAQVGSDLALQYGFSGNICCGLLNDGRLYMAATSSNGATNSSSVSLFIYNGTSFAQVGSDLALQYGFSITICCGLLNDGSLYIAATSSNGATNSSSVSLFIYNGTSFAQVGSDLALQYGSSITICCGLLNDGRLYIAATSSDAINDNNSSVSLFIYNGTSFAQVGSDLALQYGVSDTICCGLLNDGSLYIAATSYDRINNSSVSLFIYNGTSFAKVGSDLVLQYGNSDIICCGLLNDGSLYIAATSYNGTDSSVSLFIYNGTSFDQVGSDLALQYGFSGTICCGLLNDGSLYIAATSYNGTDSSVSLFTYDGTSFAQVGSDLALQYGFVYVGICCGLLNDARLYMAATSCSGTDSSVSLFIYDGTDFAKVGSDLALQYGFSYQGICCGLLNDGRLYIASISLDGADSSVSLFIYDGTSFAQVGSDLALQYGTSYFICCGLLNDGSLYIAAASFSGTDSSVSLFTLCTTPSIISGPNNQLARTGAGASFSVTTTGTALNYQWQYSADGGSTWANATGGVYSGETTATLSISDVTGLKGYEYRVIVSGQCGSPITSNTATLTVSNDAIATGTYNLLINRS